MANAPAATKDRPWRARVSFQNGESSATINPGTAVVLLSSNPAKVIKPATAGAAVTPALLAGIATKSAAPGESFDVIVGGYAPSVCVQLMTRAATTDGWASYPAIAVGDYMTVETVNGCAMRSGAGAAAGYAYQLVAMNTVASATTQASTTSNTATVSSTTIGCCVRSLV